MRQSFFAALLLVIGCGSDSSTSDRVTTACGKITDAECAKLAECKVMESGTLVTTAVCQQIRATAIDQCRTKEGAGITGGTDADIDACVQGFQELQCANLCGQVPQDPAACQKLSPTPNTQSITCAP